MNYLLILIFLPLSALAEQPVEGADLPYTEIHKRVDSIEKTSGNSPDKDFEPEEEISEDYPIPLPSDI